MLRSINKPCLAAKLLSLLLDMKNVQRSSLDEGVEPQAYGGRKMLVLTLYREGMTYDLRTI